MNSEAIRAYALAMYRANKDQEDAWYSFDGNWDVNIYQPEWLEDTVTCVVCPVVDGCTNSSLVAFAFNFPKEV